MKINIRFYFIMLIIMMGLGSILYGMLGSNNMETVTTLTDISVSEAKETITLASIFGAIMFGGLFNGLYLVYCGFKSTNHSKGVLIGVLVCIFAFPIAGFIGILTLLPVILFNLYQLIMKGRVSYIVSLNKKPYIRDGAISFEEIPDLKCRETLLFLRKEIVKKNMIVGFSFCVFIVIILLIGFLIPIKSGITTFVVIILVFFIIIVKLLSNTIFERKIVGDFTETCLYAECDAYRTTLTIDALIDYKVVNRLNVAEHLLNSLQAQNNAARIKTVLGWDKRVCSQGNLRIIMEYEALSENEKKENESKFYSDNKIKLESFLNDKKYQKMQSSVLEVLKSNEAMHLLRNEKYEEALQQFLDLHFDNLYNLVRNAYHLALCYKNLNDYNKAKEHLCFVIENGNTTCYVEKARALLKEVEGQK